jgi:glycosyltransferase involved in cell wall biosynthesis
MASYSEVLPSSIKKLDKTVSIIICTLNEELYLPKLLESIAQQKGVTYEILVIDAGSTDTTKNVVEHFAKKASMPVQFVAAMRGIAKQRNFGATLARYENLLFLDADVLLPNDFLVKATSEITDNQYLIAGTKIFAAEKSAGYRFVYWTYSNTYLPIVRLFNTVLHGCSIFVTKELHEQIGGFQSGITFEDFAYGAAAAKFSHPKLLKSTYVRTSARRFYDTSPSKIWELVKGALQSFYKKELPDSQFEGYHETAGRHIAPRY